jgi:hypothetical protein
MAKDRGRVPLQAALLEKEIRRLTLAGQRVQDEANMRRFFMAAVLRKVGRVVELTSADIEETKRILAAHEADLRVEPLDDSDGGVRLSFVLSHEPTKPTAQTVLTHALAKPVPWWRRAIARAKLWWWGVKLERGE